MRYIDKSHYAARENTINRKFLTDCLRQDGTFYPNVDSDDSYTAFCHKKYRGPANPALVTEPWITLLLEEQSDRCAYCMRIVNASNCDAEHIIPRKLDNPTDADHYYQYAPQLQPRVLPAQLYPVPSTQGKVSGTTEFPHKIALANLVATCKVNNGSQKVFCDANNHRKNDKIIPICLAPAHSLYYAPNGHCLVIENSGKIISNDFTPATLNLNTDTLKAIRMAWYLACVNSITPVDISNFVKADNRFGLIKVLLSNHGEVTESTDRISFSHQFSYTPHILESMLDYVWFYDYYTTIYPHIGLHN